MNLELLITLSAIAGIVMCFKNGRKFFYYILSSLDNFSKGASANKLSAAAAVAIAIFITKHYVTNENVFDIIIVWLVFALLCLGIIVTRQLIELVQSYKGGNQGKTQLEDKEPLHEAINESSKK